MYANEFETIKENKNYLRWQINYNVYLVVQSSLMFQFLLFYFPLFLGLKKNENECEKRKIKYEPVMTWNRNITNYSCMLNACKLSEI